MKRSAAAYGPVALSIMNIQRVAQWPIGLLQGPEYACGSITLPEAWAASPGIALLEYDLRCVALDADLCAVGPRDVCNSTQNNSGLAALRQERCATSRRIHGQHEWFDAHGRDAAIDEAVSYKGFTGCRSALCARLNTKLRTRPDCNLNPVT